MADGYLNSGTAAATAGSKTVTFAGVSVSLFRAGFDFKQSGASEAIASVDPDTNTIQLAQNWAGPTTAPGGAAYTVMTLAQSNVLTELTTRWVQYLNGPLLSIAEMEGDDAPADGQTLVWDSSLTGWVAKDIFARSGPLHVLINGVERLTLDDAGMDRSVLTLTGSVPIVQFNATSGAATWQMRADVTTNGDFGIYNPSSTKIPWVVLPTDIFNVRFQTNFDTKIVVGVASSFAQITAAYSGNAMDGQAFVDLDSGGKVWKIGSGTGQKGVFGFYNSTDGIVAGGFHTDGSFLVGALVKGGWQGDSKIAAYGASHVISTQVTGNGTAFSSRVDNTGAWYAGFYYGTSNIGSIAPNGTTGVSYNVTSARDMKMGAAPLVSTAVLDAKMYRGSWIAEPGREWVGGIADEMGLLVPEGYTPSSTPQLAPHQEGYIPDFFDYSKWVPHLIVQEQAAWARMDAIEARLAAAGIA